MNNLPAEQLQSFDAVTIRPRAAAAPAVSSTLGIAAPPTAAPATALVSSSSSGGGGASGGGDGEVKSENALATEVGGLDEGGERVAEKAGAGTSLEGASAVAATTKADGGVSEEEGGMTITVRPGLGWSA